MTCHTQWIGIDWNRRIPSERESHNPYETTYIAKFRLKCLWMSWSSAAHRKNLNTTHKCLIQRGDKNLAEAKLNPRCVRTKPAIFWDFEIRGLTWISRSLANTDLDGEKTEGEVDALLLGCTCVTVMWVIISLNRSECLWDIFVSSCPFPMKIEPSPHGMVY